MTRMPRHPSHLVYDSACDVLLAAHDLRQAASEHEHHEVVPAVLGCITATLDNLADTTRELARQSALHAGPDDAPAHAAGAAIAALTQVLMQAQRSAEVARAATAEPHHKQQRAAGISARR
jgi:hypothetical protein